jgi:hypothetical protein
MTALNVVEGSSDQSPREWGDRGPVGRRGGSVLRLFLGIPPVTQQPFFLSRADRH